MHSEPNLPAGLMGLARHGVDLVDVAVIRTSLDAYGQPYVNRLFSPAEQDLASKLADPAPFYAGRFAAKEAVVKCLGTGWRDGVPAPEIEILRQPDGRPSLRLGRRIVGLQQYPGDCVWLISISHTDHLAMASAFCLPVVQLNELKKLLELYSPQLPSPAKGVDAP